MRAFISYASEDRDQARRLYEDLADGNPQLEIWFDEVSLRGGVRWKRAIRRAIRDSDVFLLLLSPSSTTKAGYVQREIREALEVLQSLPEDRAFVVPLRLAPCEPHFELLEEIQWIDLFPDWSEGVARVREALGSRQAPAPPDGTASGRAPAPPGGKAARRIRARFQSVLDEAEIGSYSYLSGFVVTEYGDWNNLERPVTGLFTAQGKPEFLLQIGIVGECDPAHLALAFHDAVGMRKVTTGEEVKGVLVLVVPREHPSFLPFSNDNMIANTLMGDRGHSVLMREQEIDPRIFGFLSRASG